jgi:serine/threonine-protein kinase HipA
VTSKDTNECYVYIMLPGATEFVTAGRFVLEKDDSGIPLGRFVYGDKYIARSDAVAIDPIELKLNKGTFQTQLLKGVFGALRDAGPDYWGRRVIEKHVGVPELGEMDYLLNSPDDRAGALCFGLNKTPPAPKRKFNKTLDLEKLQHLADSIINNKAIAEDTEAEQVQDLLLVGTSMGGARPKTVVEDDDGLWVAKFNRPDDNWNYARIEHAMLLLARHCRIHAATSKVLEIGDRDVLMVKRFDRNKTLRGYERSRMISGLTLLQADESYSERDRWSYLLIAEELRRVCKEPQKAVQELFCRMCFNALISNTDDHMRNHAIIAYGADWALSPAYDLTPSVPISTERRDLALECGDLGRYANAKNLLSQCRRFHLEPDEAEVILKEMKECVSSNWYSIARSQGVTEKDCDQIAGAFVYPGFHY